MVEELLGSEPHRMPQYGAASAGAVAAATGRTPAATATTSDRTASRERVVRPVVMAVSFRAADTPWTSDAQAGLTAPGRTRVDRPGPPAVRPPASVLPPSRSPGPTRGGAASSGTARCRAPAGGHGTAVRGGRLVAGRLLRAVAGEGADLHLRVLGRVVLLAGHGADPAEQEADRDRDDARVVEGEPVEVGPLQHRQRLARHRVDWLPGHHRAEHDQRQGRHQAAVDRPQRLAGVEPPPEQRV